MVDWGFDFIRLPMAYPRYVEFDRSKRITPEEVCKINEQEVDRIEAFVRKAQDQGLHVSLNLHRAPGYCINAGFYEPYDLWKSKEAQEAFYFHWGMWAKRFKNVPASKISFDLLNEPALRSDMNDQHATSSLIPGDLYRTVAKGRGRRHSCRQPRPCGDCGRKPGGQPGDPRTQRPEHRPELPRIFSRCYLPLQSALGEQRSGEMSDPGVARHDERGKVRQSTAGNLLPAVD